jgi:hypothetical protein
VVANADLAVGGLDLDTPSAVAPLRGILDEVPDCALERSWVAPDRSRFGLEIAPALGKACSRAADDGLRTRRLRAALSALGIAIGVAAIVAVGLSSSSQAGLLAEIDRLGTNLLTVTNGQTLLGDTAELPLAAPGMIARIGPVTQVEETGSIDANVYRSRLIRRSTPAAFPSWPPASACPGPSARASPAAAT